MWQRDGRRRHHGWVDVTSRIEIVEYDPRWVAMFEALGEQLAAALGPLVLRIEHVGSTAVPGLAAKPIVDLDLVVAPRDLPAVIQRLAALGYQHQGDLGVAGREAFTTPPTQPPQHLYVCAPDSRELGRHLAFRDALRTRPATARAYAELKRRLARQHAADRAAYTDAKTAFVAAVLAGAPARQGR
jgi:GrpB-like predicted nucleotidyltransferase (UPF0157 family)